MTVLKIVFTIVFIVSAIALVVLVLMQDGESGGLSGSLSGSNDTFWAKNKGRSAEGKVERATKYLVIVFMILSLLLNLPIFA